MYVYIYVIDIRRIIKCTQNVNAHANLHRKISTILKPSGGMKVLRGRSHIISTNFSVGTDILSRVVIGVRNIVMVSMNICSCNTCFIYRVL